MPVDRMFHPTIGDSEKITLLSDGEFRVWFTYNMAADDFGVLPMLASKLKGADRSLSNWPSRRLEKALQQLVDIALVRRFEAQKAGYIWTPSWQWYQKIRYPRREQTHYPAPPEVELVALSDKVTAPTRALFATFHMKVTPEFRAEYGDADTIAKIAIREQSRSGTKPQRSGDVPGMEPERSGDVATLTRARAPETAHGLRLTADGFGSLEGSPRETDPPIDAWWMQLRGLYPQHRAYPTDTACRSFAAQLQAFPQGPHVGWEVLKANLVLNIESHEWRSKGMVPALETYIVGKRWMSVLPADAPVGDRLSQKTNRTLEAAAKIMKESA